MARTNKPMLLLLFLLLLAPGSLAWYSNSWSYRKAITVDASQVNGSNTNFPLLVNIGSDASLAAHALANGSDILFTNSADAKLPHEIEYYNSTTGALVAWVQVANLTNATNTTLYLYYGNSGANNQQSKTGVWDNNYDGVWHLPDGNTLTANDSTVNGNTGTLLNSPSPATGQIGGAATFTNGGSATAINVGTGGSISSLQVPMTISAWFKPTTTPALATVFSQYKSTGSSQLIKMIRLDSGTVVYYMSTSAGGFQSVSYSGNPSTNNWHYVTVAVSGSTASPTVSITLDGSKQTFTPSSLSSSPDTTVTTRIGDDEAQPTTEGFTGAIDEVRISNTTRSDQWIATEYNNQKTGATMLTLGTEEWQPFNSANWSTKRTIIIDYTQVNGTQTNFPLLIRIASDSSIASKAQASGNDIVFTDNASNRLDHEIESYNSTTGALVAWVRIPTLSNASNTILYMYYGNSTVGSQANPTGVWDSTYFDVVHFTNGTNLSISDSSPKHDSFTYTLGSNLNATPGIIDGAEQFSGASVTGANLFTAPQTTMETWLNIMSLPGSKETIFQIQGPSGWISISNTGNASASVYPWGDSPSSTNLSKNTWYHVAFVLDGSYLRLYVNGTQIGSPLSAGSWSPVNSMVNIGYATTGNYKLDEFKVSNVGRSGAWLQTEYNNQKSGSTMVTLLPTFNSTGWSTNRTITVDASQVNGTQTNFPLLIRIASDSSIASKAQASGNDIVFTDNASNRLDHEIESYNTTSGALVAWVRIPTLSNTTNTVLSLYYGNPNATNQQNPTGVWDSNYNVVYHLNENGTAPTFNDSTSNALFASAWPGNANATNGQVAGAQNLSYYGADTRNSKNITSSGYWTVEGWVNPGVLNPYSAFLGQNIGSGNSIFVGVDGGTGAHWYVLGAGLGGDSGIAQPGTGIWTHLVIAYSGNNMTLYVNGSPAHTYTGTPTNHTPAIFALVSSGDAYTQAKLDEVRFSTTARSAQWIQTEYNNMKTGSTMVTMSGGLSCTPSSGQPWNLVMDDNCTIAGLNITVGSWTITGNGTAWIMNSNITYTNRTLVHGPGSMTIYYLPNVMLVKK
jgi:hypothetical protein